MKVLVGGEGKRHKISLGEVYLGVYLQHKDFVRGGSVPWIVLEGPY